MKQKLDLAKVLADHEEEHSTKIHQQLQGLKDLGNDY